MEKDSKQVTNFEEKPLQEARLVNYWKLSKNRIFYIEGAIDDEVLEVQRHILDINIEDFGIEPEKRKPIILLITTPGGYVTETMSLADAIVSSKTPVHTVNIGDCYSGGFLLLISGHKRFALKHAIAMCHTGSAVNGGTYEQTEAFQKTYKKLVDNMGAFILQQTKIDPKTFAKNKAKDWYMMNDECLKYGIIDKEIESLDELIMQ